jgi:hypothetical protein
MTGLSLEEVVNNLLAAEVEEFQPDVDWNQHVENTLGCWKFNHRAGAERTLEWVKKKVRKGHGGKFPIVETAIRGAAGGIRDRRLYNLAKWRVRAIH